MATARCNVAPEVLKRLHDIFENVQGIYFDDILSFQTLQPVQCCVDRHVFFIGFWKKMNTSPCSFHCCIASCFGLFFCDCNPWNFSYFGNSLLGNNCVYRTSSIQSHASTMEQRSSHDPRRVLGCQTMGAQTARATTSYLGSRRASATLRLSYTRAKEVATLWGACGLGGGGGRGHGRGAEAITIHPTVATLWREGTTIQSFWMEETTRGSS